MATVFMPLLQEGTDAWRPVEVIPLEGAEYRVEGPMPDGEIWKFAPGSLIQIRWKKFADGRRRLIPKGPAPTVRSISADYFQRNVGILIGVFPLLLIITWLPRQPDGRLEAAPFLVITAASALLAAAVLIWRKPQALVPKWAIWSALSFGVLFSLSLAFDAL